MALKSPLMPSPTSAALASAYSPYADSPHSPVRFSSNHIPASAHSQSNRSSGQSEALAPPSPYPQQIEPSPVDSNGTDGTEIEEGAQEDIKDKSPSSPNPNETRGLQSPDIEITSPDSSDNPPRIDTSVSTRQRADSADDGPQSVIHAPSGFKDFQGNRRSHSTAIQRSSQAVVSPVTPEAIPAPQEDKKPSSISPVNTDIPRYMDRSTPRAQTRPEFDEDSKRRSVRTSSRTSSLEDIPEALDKDDNEHDVASTADRPSTAVSLVTAPEATEKEAPSMSDSVQSLLTQGDEEVEALRTALSECWTLCNTLASLSASHRQRTFKFAGRTEVQEHAWQSCWRFCKQLYEHKDKDHVLEVRPTLELCRDFCQALFDARQKTDEAADSVLRVSFELNNHLYNTHGRTAPDAFNERTLDFYITLCHRLMKQRTSLPPETDALLRACWSLAEMLFNLRQSTRDGKAADEELLGSAVQACWELCDLFREGWTQIRPDRNTPRPSQTTFDSSVSISFRSNSTASGGRSVSSTRSNLQYHEAVPFPPETPITIFDDTSTADSSPDAQTVPNILVLGPVNAHSTSSRNTHTHHDRWSSNASAISGSDNYSESAKSTSSSQRSGSTATINGENAHVHLLRYLLLKAGMETGYTRARDGQPLPAYVATLPPDAFGELPWQRKVLTYYRRLVTGDQTMQSVHTLPSRRLTALEAAMAVRWLGDNHQWAWMRDLFRLVFGFGVDEAERRGGWYQI